MAAFQVEHGLKGPLVALLPGAFDLWYKLSEEQGKGKYWAEEMRSVKMSPKTIKICMFSY